MSAGPRVICRWPAGATGCRHRSPCRRRDRARTPPATRHRVRSGPGPPARAQVATPTGPVSVRGAPPVLAAGLGEGEHAAVGLGGRTRFAAPARRSAFSRHLRPGPGVPKPTAPERPAQPHAAASRPSMRGWHGQERRHLAQVHCRRDAARKGAPPKTQAHATGEAGRQRRLHGDGFLLPWAGGGRHRVLAAARAPWPHGQVGRSPPFFFRRQNARRRGVPRAPRRWANRYRGRAGSCPDAGERQRRPADGAAGPTRGLGQTARGDRFARGPRFWPWRRTAPGRFAYASPSSPTTAGAAKENGVVQAAGKARHVEIFLALPPVARRPGRPVQA